MNRIYIRHRPEQSEDNVPFFLSGGLFPRLYKCRHDQIKSPSVICWPSGDSFIRLDGDLRRTDVLCHMRGPKPAVDRPASAAVWPLQNFSGCLAAADSNSLAFGACLSSFVLLLTAVGATEAKRSGRNPHETPKAYGGFIHLSLKAEPSSCLSPRVLYCDVMCVLASES